jgi:hypothetical protein
VVTAKDVQDRFTRLRSPVVLDGLDEVGSPAIRTRVVEAIDKFASRGKVYDDPPKVVVTTRPSAGELAEPSTDLFEVLALNPLTLGQRGYLRKWCAVRAIHGKYGRELRTGFRDKSREPYIGELARPRRRLAGRAGVAAQHTRPAARVSGWPTPAAAGV